MIIRLSIFIFCVSLLSACSWIERFFVVNTTGSPITLEVQLMSKAGNFPIFDARSFYAYPVSKNGVSCDKPTEIKPLQLSDDRTSYTIELPASTALEIGRLQNDKYEKYNQYFINDRVFNLESIVIKSGGKEWKIVPATFDTYFKKKKGNIYYYVP